MSSTEFDATLVFRTWQVQKDSPVELARLTGRTPADLLRQMVADGLRRAHAAPGHPAVLPDELRPAADA